jgi:hypothetical protein
MPHGGDETAERRVRERRTTTVMVEERGTMRGDEEKTC